MAGVYDIFTKITLENRVSPVLAIISREILGLEASVAKLSKSFDHMGMAAKIAIGGLGIAGSVGLIAGLKKVADSSKELLNQQEQLNRVGVSLSDVNRLTAKGFQDVAKSVPTAQVSEYLKVIRELRGAVGSTGQAEALAPPSPEIAGPPGEYRQGGSERGFLAAFTLG